MDLCTEPAGCSLFGGPHTGAAGHAPAGLSGDQQVTTQAVMYIGSLSQEEWRERVSVFLVNADCTYNLLSRTVFDRLPAETRQQMVYGETVAAMADSSG